MGSTCGVSPRRKAAPYDEALRIIAFKVRPEMQKAIRHQAVEEDLDVSELIRRAVSRYLAAAQQQAEQPKKQAVRPLIDVGKPMNSFDRFSNISNPFN